MWQDCFEKSWQEVPVSKQVNGIEKRHIADIKTSNGWTIEFQYSHLSTNDILERQEFYGEMVWVVSGIRLERDRRMGEDLMKYTQSFESPEGLKYVVARVDDLPRYDFWTTVDKFVFFDFKGGFNMQQFDDQLLCLLPREINNERLFVIVPKNRLVESFKEGRERSLLIQLWGCRKAYKKKLEEIDERRIEELRQDSAHVLLPGSAKYAITLGWVQAWLWINGKITDCEITEGVGMAEPSDSQGWIAIHCQTEYTKENYEEDVDYAKNEFSWSWRRNDIDKDLPSYEQLQRYGGAVVAKARYKKIQSGAAWQGWRLKMSNFIWLEKAVHNVPDGKDIWMLPDTLAVDVNDSKSHVDSSSTNKDQGAAKEETGVPSFVYTGKGNLYRDSKTNWLHIEKNGTMIPLKKENQDWDKTYDSHFRKRW